MIERGVSSFKAIKDLFQTTPLESLLPGPRREQMATFLQRLPSGGLSFHGTSSLYWGSILTHGLESKFASPETHPSGKVNYFALDPQTDPVLTREPNSRGMVVATYYRMENSIRDAISYGEQQNFSIRHNKGDHRVAAPLVVVFRAPQQDYRTAYKFGSDIPRRLRREHTELLGLLPHRVIEKVPPNQIIKCFLVDPTREVGDVISELFSEISTMKWVSKTNK